MTEVIQYRCDCCNKLLCQSDLDNNYGIILIEKGYDHTHHFCNHRCLGKWAKGYAK